MLEDLDVVKGFLNGGTIASKQEKYQFIEQPALTGTPQYNTNNIISDKEFITHRQHLLFCNSRSGC